MSLIRHVRRGRVLASCDGPVARPKDGVDYFYFPGWHQPATMIDLHFAVSAWNGHSPSHQATLEIACGDLMREMTSVGIALQFSAMQEMRRNGIELRRWPAEFVVSFEHAWLEIVAEEASLNPKLARVWASYADLRESRGIWKHFSFLQQVF